MIVINFEFWVSYEANKHIFNEIEIYIFGHFGPKMQAGITQKTIGYFAKISVKLPKKIT